MTDDKVCMIDDRLLDDEIVDIDSGSDNTGLGKITNVEGVKLEQMKKPVKTV